MILRFALAPTPHKQIWVQSLKLVGNHGSEEDATTYCQKLRALKRQHRCMRVSWVGVLEVNVSERELEIAMVIHSEICELYITLDEDIHYHSQSFKRTSEPLTGSRKAVPHINFNESDTCRSVLQQLPVKGFVIKAFNFRYGRKIHLPVPTALVHSHPLHTSS